MPRSPEFPRTRGLTLDTGALVAIERRKRQVLAFVDRCLDEERDVTVPTAVIAEWWRGQRGMSRALQGMRIEVLDERIARLAGESLASLSSGSSITDAIVMASAANRGDIVLTSDVSDLEALRQYFPAVTVLGVNRTG